MDAAGGLPDVEFFGHSGVFVLDEGVEGFDILPGGEEDLADGFGVFYAGLGFGLVVLVGLGEGVVVGAEVGYEVGSEVPIGEFGDEGGFGGDVGGAVDGADFEDREQAFGVGADVFFSVGRNGVVGGAAAKVGGADGEGGAGDGFEVEVEGVKEGGLAGAGGDLADFGGGE